MKINFDDFEIEIKAKENHDKRFNQNDTCYLLNQISIWAHEASENYERLGLDGLAYSAQKSSLDIYNVLNDLGFFNDVRKKEVA